MLANIIGITLSTSAFAAFVYFILRDIAKLERDHQNATKRQIANQELEVSYQANIAAEWRG